jgi:hypothetical protein
MHPALQRRQRAPEYHREKRWAGCDSPVRAMAISPLRQWRFMGLLLLVAVDDRAYVDMQHEADAFRLHQERASPSELAGQAARSWT